MNKDETWYYTTHKPVDKSELVRKYMRVEERENGLKEASLYIHTPDEFLALIDRYATRQRYRVDEEGRCLYVVMCGPASSIPPESALADQVKFPVIERDGRLEFVIYDLEARAAKMVEKYFSDSQIGIEELEKQAEMYRGVAKFLAAKLSEITDTGAEEWMELGRRDYKQTPPNIEHIGGW